MMILASVLVQEELACRITPKLRIQTLEVLHQMFLSHAFLVPGKIVREHVDCVVQKD